MTRENDAGAAAQWFLKNKIYERGAYYKNYDRVHNNMKRRRKIRDFSRLGGGGG